MELVGLLLIVVGAGLSVLAAWGIVDFPTPLARMHAATKPASLGLASLVLGAGLADGSWGLVTLGVLVAGGLFLTTPISGHLLGRAAYLAGQATDLVHDDLTGRTPRRSTPPPSASGFNWFRVAALTVTWMILWRDLAWGTAAAGAIVATAVEVAVGGGERGARVSLPGAARFAVRYVGLVISSTARVAWEVITPRNERVREAIVAVPLEVRSDAAAVLLANAITYTPGTLTIDLSDEHLFVHVLHFEDVERTVDDVRRVQAWVMAALPEARAGA